MPHWTETFYEKLDSGDHSSADHMAPDIRVQVGNDPVVIGREAAFSGPLGRILSAINGIRHEVLSRQDVTSDRAIIEFATVYTLKDNSQVSLPVVTIIGRNAAGEIADLRLYFDPSPLFS